MLNEKYYSNLQSMIIPLYGFKSYHHACNREDDIKNFIGRTSIVAKLASWLKDTRASKYTGAYLITGYRGMGKSTFVYKAIKRLIEENEYEKYDKYSPNDKVKYVPVTINVGNELLETKDLLAMFCKLTSLEFDNTIRGRYGLISKLNTIILSICINIPFILYILYGLGVSSFASEIIRKILGFIGFFHIHNSFVESTLVLILCFILCFSGRISNNILYFLWKQFGNDYFITIAQIKKHWGYLIERINAEVTLKTEAGTNIEGNKLHGIGLYLKYGTTAVYPIAGVPEMQENLVKLLELIYRHRFTKLRFIYVIDELDKLSPKSDEKMTMPEYNITDTTNDSSTYRTRQNALASMIANMKYFVSSSRAKFIFITGYDMYEATLTDISDREFSIHSIFNGQINVSSFFRRTSNFSGIDSMMEQYLCQLLIDKDEIQISEHADKVPLNLSLYSKYHKQKWEQMHLRRHNNELFQKTLERRIVFLHNFLTYLVYLSNGSPKKLSIYIEKFIRTKDIISAHIKNNGNRFVNDDVNLGLGDTDYYLYFDSRNLMRICFVNYLIYPMVQNLINKSNIYNDKLLVSTSFMLSNLYKFHKSGFSMRNLEYMPELLDINKTPELRDFIGGIVEFMTQTHIDESVINLYKYRFPMRLSEEITFFSKTSEEISFLFNFSHDELLSVKKLYMRQLQHYESSKEAHGTASLHHMLGDIYMLEENYELAIYEFQEALSALRRQETAEPSIHPYKFKDTSRILFYVRVSLKLGLAYEKRKTLDTAYLHYKNLVDTLLYIVKEKPERIYASISRQKKESPLANIRIMYLAPLAKFFVLEKMDLGGFTPKDIKVLIKEQQSLINDKVLERRPLTAIDFYCKYGDILYYRNVKDEHFMEALEDGIDQEHFKCKNEKCKGFIKERTSHYSPCAACLCYNKSIMMCIEKLIEKKLKNIEEGQNSEDKQNDVYGKYASKSILFLKWLSKSEYKIILHELGTAQISIIANSLVGMGNCLLGCGKKCSDSTKQDTSECSFYNLNYIVSYDFNNKDKEGVTANNNEYTSFVKAILYYIAASKIYAITGEYKAAYNLNNQILDAIFARIRVKGTEEGEQCMKFVEKITEKTIQYAFEHYRHINTAEINKLKSALDISIAGYINLDYLSNFPDIEIVIYKYYQIRLLCSDENKKPSILNKILDSRQLGVDKIISSFTQDIQNMYFKEFLNEQIMSILMPGMKTLFTTGRHDLLSTLKTLKHYFYDDNSFILFENNIQWNIFDKNDCRCDRKYQLLKYLIADSLFCLNKISDLITPQYNTPLYNNAFIGEIYEKGSIWNHILITFRETLLYTESKDKELFLSHMMKRYNMHSHHDEIRLLMDDVSNYLSTVPSWINEKTNGIDTITDIYDRICPRAHRRLTNSYLLGNALDYYRHAIDMHSSGKTYKEMMTTLYFLEDDLRNDSLYFNFAVELYYLNTNYIQEKVKKLLKYYNANKDKGLFDKNNYIN